MKKFFLGFFIAVSLLTICSFTVKRERDMGMFFDTHLLNVDGKKFVVVENSNGMAICPW